MAWLLIIVMQIGGYNHSVAIMQRFENQVICERAGRAVLEQFPKGSAVSADWRTFKCVNLYVPQDETNK